MTRIIEKYPIFFFLSLFNFFIFFFFFFHFNLFFRNFSHLSHNFISIPSKRNLKTISPSLILGFLKPSVKIGCTQRRLAWPLRKVDKHNREVPNFFFFLFFLFFFFFIFFFFFFLELKTINTKFPIQTFFLKIYSLNPFFPPTPFSSLSRFSFVFFRNFSFFIPRKSLQNSFRNNSFL